MIPISGVTAQTLLGEWLDHCGTRPPKQIVGQVAKLLGQMIAEGIPPDRVRTGLAEWHHACAVNDRGQHPATLPSFVHAAQVRGQSPPRRRSTTDDRVAAGLELAAKYAALDAAESGPA